MNIQALLRDIEASVGLRLRLGAKYHHGEQGAFAVKDQQGQKYVLKWNPSETMVNHLQRSVQFIEHLQRKGYPAPYYRAFGVAQSGTYSLQYTLPGTPQETLSLGDIDYLIHLTTLQRDDAPLAAVSWREEVIDAVINGREDYCVHSSIHRYSPETQRILRDCIRLTERYQEGVPYRNDIVHFDFNHYNILFHWWKISGIVDWEDADVGDASFDLVTLLFYEYENLDIRNRLWDAALRYTSAQGVAVYLCHMMVRQLDWSIRFHGYDMVSTYLRICTIIIEDLRFRVRG